MQVNGGVIECAGRKWAVCSRKGMGSSVLQNRSSLQWVEGFPPVLRTQLEGRAPGFQRSVR
jgi:hypothetical protein